MKYFTLFVSLLATIILQHSLAFAGGQNEDALAKALEEYQATGTTKKCVRVNDIRRTKVIDNQHILFELRGGEAYLNTLPHRCPRLAVEDRFSYRVTVGQLCNVDTITVLTATPISAGATCGLGTFEVYIKREQEE